MAQRGGSNTLNIRKIRTGEVLEVHPYCLMYFVDETGHQDFADPNFPIYGMGECGLFAAAIERDLRGPWRRMKNVFRSDSLAGSSGER